jgi:hypothetical protein
MKYHQIVAALLEEPLLITAGAHASLARLFEEHRTLDAEEFKARREGVDYCGEEVELEQMEVIDGIAHIPISGPIGKGLGKFEKGAGAVDVDDVMTELDEAEDDPNVRAIILDIDSPGGMVSGTPELADRVAACQKPVYAFTAGQMCSAAYWIACAGGLRVRGRSRPTSGASAFMCPTWTRANGMKMPGSRWKSSRAANTREPACLVPASVRTIERSCKRGFRISRRCFSRTCRGTGRMLRLMTCKGRSIRARRRSRRG